MSGTEHIKLIECPRDAMQGFDDFIPTEKKAAYVNALLRVGFDTVDFGSFVSPKAVPQMKDTPEVLKLLNLDGVNTKLLAIVGNSRGAEDAVDFDEIDCVGFPFSVSETFLRKNIRSGMESAFETALIIHNLCEINGKETVIYISMAFGNPYGDPWHADIVSHWVDRLAGEDISMISLADTVGGASPQDIAGVVGTLALNFPDIEFGAHFHARPDRWEEKVEAAWQAGCRRFDGAIKGFGGCPMASDKLVGNIATENLIGYIQKQGQKPGLDSDAFLDAYALASSTFPS